MLGSSSLYVATIEFSLKGRLMLTVELSMFDLVMTIAVVVLVLMFITLLLKLNPSSEKKQIFDEDIVQETSKSKSLLSSEPQPHQTLPNLQHSPEPTSPKFGTVDSWQNQQIGKKGSASQEPREEAQRIVASATVGGASEVKKEPEMPSAYQLQAQRRTAEPSPKPVTMAQNSREKECPHKFGYLRDLPKNRPIPNECFGCPKIVECLVKKKES